MVKTLAAQTQHGSSSVPNLQHGQMGVGLACAYVDSTVRDVQWVGSAYDGLSGSGPTSPVRDGFLLRTCERVEVYTSSGSTASQSAHPFSDVAVGVGGAAAVRRRLAEIATGASSRLLGERFIAGQVERAGRTMPATHPLRELVAEAVRMARRVRVDHNFAASADYPDLIERLLRDAGRAKSRSLVVVGSGVLARTVMRHRLALGYRQVLPVTRSVKRLRKRVPGSQLRICSPGSVWDQLDGSGWDAVIATTNMVEPYRTRIGELIADRRCRVAVDVSCVPLLAAPPDGHYHNLYGSAFSTLIADQNSVIAAKAERVRAAIKSIHMESPR